MLKLVKNKQKLFQSLIGRIIQNVDCIQECNDIYVNGDYMRMAF